MKDYLRRGIKKQGIDYRYSKRNPMGGIDIRIVVNMKKK
ncbi:DUF1310 domain-containing protein [Gemella cuniculi]|nr:DUF1310 domain-containing protein [Gemella cuniculi]